MTGSQLLWANAIHYAELKLKFKGEGAMESAQMYGEIAATYAALAELTETCEARRAA
jgi:hypothetical protein